MINYYRRGFYMKDFIISIEDLKKSYGNHSVLNGLNLEVERGSIFALLGENGAGKTTTVQILSTLIAGFDTKHEANSVKEIISLTGQYTTVDDYNYYDEGDIDTFTINDLQLNDINKRTATDYIAVNVYTDREEEWVLNI